MDKKYYEMLFKMKIIGTHKATLEELNSVPYEKICLRDELCVYDDVPPMDEMNHLLLFNMAKNIRTIKQIIVASLVISIIFAVILIII